MADSPFSCQAADKPPDMFPQVHFENATPATSPALDDRSIHLWLIRFDPLAPTPVHWLSILQPAELSRMERFKHLPSRQRFVLSRYWLRVLLSHYCGVPAASIPFSQNPQGKPHIEDSSIQFNLAHSGGAAVIAFARNQPVGVDIEFIRPLQDLEGIVRNYFTPSEQQLILSCEGRRREQSFFKAWSCKEAVMKADGRGLSLPPDRFEVMESPDSPAPHCLVKSVTGVETRWHLMPFEPCMDAYGCMAVSEPVQSIRAYALGPPEILADFAIS